MACNVSYYDRKGWLAIQKSDNIIAFFDIYKDTYINEIQVKEKIVFFFFHDDSEKFTLVCSAGEFYDYDINSWELLQIKVLKGKSYSEGYFFSDIPDKIFIKSYNNEIDIITKSNYQLINNRGFSFPIIDLKLSSDGTTFFVGIPQNYILPCKIDLSSSGKLITLPNKIGKFFISEDNSSIFSLLDGVISVFSLKDLKKIYEFETKYISSYEILPDKKTVILGDNYGNIIYYDIILNKPLTSEKVHSSAIRKLFFIKERNILFSISNFGEISLKSLDTDYIFLSDPILLPLSTIEGPNQISLIKPIFLTESSTIQHPLRIVDLIQPISKIKSGEILNVLFENNNYSSIISSVNLPISSLNNFEGSQSIIPLNPIISDTINKTVFCNTDNIASPEITENPILIKCLKLISDIQQIRQLSSNIVIHDSQKLASPISSILSFDQKSTNIHIYPASSQISVKCSIIPSNIIHYEILPFLIFPEVRREIPLNSHLEFDLFGDATVSVQFDDLFKNSSIQLINYDLEIVVDGKELNTNSDISGFQIPIFEEMRVAIKKGNDLKRITNFSGVSDSHPFLLFIDEGKRKIDNPKDIKKDFILITSKNYSLIPENCFRNCGRVTNWENYYFYEIPYEKSILYAIRTDEGRIIPIANDIGILSELHGGTICENLPVTNTEKIYCKAPDLIIQSIPAIIEDLNIEITFKDRSIFLHAVDILSPIENFQYKLPLSNFLNPEEAGTYSIIIQNDKNDFQISHSFILVPELKIEIENKEILFYTWDKDHVDISFIIEGPDRINHAQEIRSKYFKYKSNVIFLRDNTDIKKILTLYYSTYSIEIELLVPVIFSKISVLSDTTIKDHFIDVNDYEKIVSIFPSGEKSLERELPKEIFDLDNNNISVQVFIPWYLRFSHYNLYVSCSDDASIHFQDFNHFKLKKYNNNYVIREYDLNRFKGTIQAHYSLFPLTFNYEGNYEGKKSITNLFSIVSWVIGDFDISIDNNEITAQWEESCLLKHNTSIKIYHNNSKNEVSHNISQKNASAKIILPFNDLSEIQSVSLSYEISLNNHMIDSTIIDNIDASSDISLLKSYLKMNHVNGAMKVLPKLPDDIKTYYEAHIYGLFYGDYSKAKKILSNNIKLPMNLVGEKWFFSYLYYSLLDSQNMDTIDQKAEEILKNIIAQNPDNNIALLLYAVYLSTSGPLTVVNILEMLNHINQEYYLPTHYLIEGESKIHLSQFGFEVNMMKTAVIVKSGLTKYPYIPQYWKLINKLFLQMDKTNLQSISLIISHTLSNKEKIITSKVGETLEMYVKLM